MSARDPHPLDCMRKKHFASEGAADGVIYNMRARNQDTERLESYKCPHCGDWHLRQRPPGFNAVPA